MTALVVVKTFNPIANRYLDLGLCSPSGSAVGGLISTKSAGTVTNGFFDVQTSSLGTDGTTSGSDGGTGESTAHAQTQGTYTNGDFNLFWWMLASDYPRLQWE